VHPSRGKETSARRTCGGGINVGLARFERKAHKGTGGADEAHQGALYVSRIEPALPKASRRRTWHNRLGRVSPHARRRCRLHAGCGMRTRQSRGRRSYLGPCHARWCAGAGNPGRQGSIRLEDRFGPRSLVALREGARSTCTPQSACLVQYVAGTPLAFKAMKPPLLPSPWQGRREHLSVMFQRGGLPLRTGASLFGTKFLATVHACDGRRFWPTAPEELFRIDPVLERLSPVFRPGRAESHVASHPIEHPAPHPPASRSRYDSRSVIPRREMGPRGPIFGTYGQWVRAAVGTSDRCAARTP